MTDKLKVTRKSQRATPVGSSALLASAKPDMTTLDGVADAVHELAWAKGWHKTDENEDAFVERACNNLHDEVSELHEAWRNNQLRSPCDKSSQMIDLDITPLSCIEEEMADIIIRVLDNARKRKHQFNAARPHRHGGKRS
jgi:NTP pyrophosphatase (non-canonical NTP hydrolase)